MAFQTRLNIDAYYNRPPLSPSSRRRVSGAWWDISLLFLVGLLAMGWFHRGYLIKTEDVALPFDPQRWWQYAHAWNNLIDLGIQFWENFSGLVFLAIPAALQGLGLSMAVTQRLEYVFWFTLPGLSMYYLMTRVAPSPAGRPARLVASVFYMCNLYLEPIWQGLNIANLSAYATLPALLSLVMQGVEAPRRWWTIPLIGLISLVAAGVGTNPPLLVAALLPIPCYLLFDLVRHRRWQRPRELWDLAHYMVKVLAVVIAVNSFWLLPQIAAFQEQGPGATVDRAVAVDVSRSWLRGVSAATSPLNTLRLQGHWVWFEGRGDEPYTPYAKMFKSNPWVIGMSFLLPALVWGTLLAPAAPLEIFFAALAFLGLWLGIGVHPPYGVVYDWMVQHVPLFWIIRSPWYKFSLLTCLGYAVLLGGFASRLSLWMAGRLRRRRGWRPGILSFAAVCPAGIMLLSLAYAFPVSLGKMYPTSHDRRYLAPSHVRIPAYVHEAAAWVNAQPWIRRLMVLPAQRVFATQWGFTDYMPPLTYFTPKPLVFNYGRSGWTATATSKVIGAIQRALRQGTTRDLQRVLALLNIDALMVSHDVVTAQQVDFEDYPNRLAMKLQDQLGITAEHTVGALAFYRVAARLPRLYTTRDLSVIEGEPEALPTLANAGLLDLPTVLFASQQNPATLSTLWRHGFVRRLVCFNAPAQTLTHRIPEWASGGPSGSARPAIELFYTSDRMETALDAPPRDLQVARLDGLSPPETFNGQAWRWLLTNNQPNVLIMNTASAWRYGNVGFHAYAYGRPRSLYTYLNGALVGQHSISEDGTREIRLPRLRFKPGLNSIAWYSPEAHDARGDLAANFALRDVTLSAPVITQTVEPPVEGQYRLWWYLESTPDEPIIRLTDSAWIGPRQITFHSTVSAGRPAFVSDPIALARGPVQIRCAPLINTRLALRLSLDDSPPAGVPPRPVFEEATATRRSPTRYAVSCPTAGPQLLVFNEGFHPAWRLQMGSQASQRPIPINGCLNGYWIDPAAAPVAGWLEFTPQRLFVNGSLISLGAVAGCLLALGWGLTASRRQGKGRLCR